MRIAVLSWRDLTHPEGGGAERYAHTVCAGLAALGHEVTLLCADHGGAPRRERHPDGYRILRQGGRLGVYPRSLLRLRSLERAQGRLDVVVDVQNGLPFAARLATRTPVVVLVHHVHREQWPVVFGRVVATLGWWLESRVSPRLYAGCQYVAVSGRTRDELAELGVRPEHVSVIHNGTELPLDLGEPRAAEPRLVVLGRLVPHKRVELAVDVVVALRERLPGLRLHVIGDGWWRDEIAAHVQAVGAGDAVALLGHVDEETKHRELAAAWVCLAPSLKEGWGLSVIEAASHGVPTVAFHGAGGLSESVLDGFTGLLAHDQAELVAHTERLLTDDATRAETSRAARAHARRFSWADTVRRWDGLLRHVAAGLDPVAEVDQVVATPADPGRPGSATGPDLPGSEQPGSDRPGPERPGPDRPDAAERVSA
ncbi:glycosyltransferase family 4 protein [Arsenicicoccus dermatophilus]|uniref:glycosyltransferase family 4 protein n=1 Tax=Arsenicicoccus dermatophilus TaxID=1076331 RepID=UPI001F4D0102|nr:glycosyltransferase family 4 protein [Arsenicicoccus dermatophilus]